MLAVRSGLGVLGRVGIETGLAMLATEEVASASVLARGDTAGLVDAIVRAREEAPSAAIALTGGSELILRLRAALKERGLADVRTKTYWVPGRQGLD